MGSFSRIASINLRSSTPLDVPGLPSPFQSLSLELSQDELRETSYEIFAASCRAASGISNIVKSKSSLNYVPQASQKMVSANAASTIKKALGLRSKKGSEKEQLAASSNSKKPQTVVDIVKMQMGVSDQTDTRIRRALSRTAAGQVGKNVDMMLLPVELLQQIRLADFADVKEYQLWQKRQLKVLELGLLLHPAVKLEEPSSAAQCMRQVLQSSAGKPLETGKNSESMQALRSAATTLASRSDDNKMQDVCHWADGLPFNLHLYQMLLSSCFDKIDETNLIDEVDDVIDLFKKTWSILGLHQALHNICLLWVLFRQFVVTGQKDLDLLRATNTQMVEVAVDAKGNKDSQYVLVLSSVLTSVQTWVENRLFAYHDTFPNGATGLMENLLPVALNAAKILHEDISHEFRRKRREDFDVTSNKIDSYVRSSLKTAFAQMMEKTDSRRMSFNKKGPVLSLVLLANNTSELIKKERDKFSPTLSYWHPCAASLAAATLHSCFSRELKQYLSGVTALTNESVEILQAADHLEKDLVQIAVEGAVDSDDGGKGVIREMVPYEAQSAIVSLSKSWIQERVGRLREWVDRNVSQEDWNSGTLREHYGSSIVEVFRLIEETIDGFYALPVVESSILLEDLVPGLDKALVRYVGAAKNGCGSKMSLIPAFPPLTRCKESKSHGSFSGLWKKKDRSPVPNRSKAQENGGQNVGSITSKICVRINTLYHIQSQLDVLEARLSQGWLKGSGHSKPVKGSKSQQLQQQASSLQCSFELTRAGIQDGIPALCEVAVYNVIYKDLRSEFWEGLYSGTVAQARIDRVLRSLESQLVFMAEIVNEKLRTRIIGALMKACFETLLMVLLAGGPSRAFYINDAEMLDDDFTALKDLFKADGEGLPNETVEKAARVVTQVLPLFAMSTEDVVQNLRQSLVESQKISSSRSRWPLPEYTGQWGPTDADTLLRVLCYRCDPAASKFLKKAYDLPKRT
ncbi:hypothetical protein L7F22_049093 [Adiantum nelumboides]|nr:hypothetical protein [Adiantum nelumboides]